MRTVTLVERIALDFNGNVSQNAIALGDVDNDGRNELVVGNNRGDLAIFKGRNPWKSCSDLGHITALGIGDLLNLGRKILVVVSADGWCFIFDIEEVENEDCRKNKKFVPSYKQRIPANVKELKIADVNGDGFTELLVTLSDRVIRTYRWHHTADLYSQRLAGHLTPLNKWEFASQIGSVTLNRNSNGNPVIFVAQPGGAFLKLICRNEDVEAEDEDEDYYDNDKELLSKMSLDYEPLQINSMRNLNVSSEILGGFATGKNGNGSSSSPYAIATLDGTIMLVQEEETKFKLKVNHQLFCLNKLDICGDGRDELIVSSWDGHTYIISQDSQPLEFLFDESIATFTAGLFSIDEGSSDPTPVLVYVTFTNKIYIYYNINLARGIAMQSLLTSLRSSKMEKVVEEALNNVVVTTTTTSRRDKISDLFKFILYDFPTCYFNE